jgi:hypothetical protein
MTCFKRLSLDVPLATGIALVVAFSLPAGPAAAQNAAPPGAPPPAANAAPAADEPPPGESGSVVQVANLIYARVKSSVCFSDHFLRAAEQHTRISTSRRFHPVKLASRDVFKHPFLIMTGEGAYTLPEEERKNLADYLKAGGFLLASAGCSSQDWDRAFRREIAQVLPDHPLKPLDFSHPVFHTVKDIGAFEMKHGNSKPLEGIEIEGRLAVIYSSDGLNDTAHVSGCCCCGGNEIRNAIDVNVNILAYVLTH